jgi:hypothetical protein
MALYALDEGSRSLGGSLTHSILQYHPQFFIVPAIGRYTSLSIQNDSIQDIPVPADFLHILF